MGMGQNPFPLVNIKIAGKWMFIPLKMVLIGIDPYPYQFKIQIIWHMFLRDDHPPFSEHTTDGVVNRLTNCLLHDVYVHNDQEPRHKSCGRTRYQQYVGQIIVTNFGYNKHNQLSTSTINDGSNIGFYNDDVGLRSLYTV